METAAGTMATSPVVLVDITTDQGITGHSYARCYTSVALAPLHDLIANLGEALTGSSERPEDAQTAMRGYFRLVGPQGLTGMAMAAIDMALWDAAAKAAGLPLFRFLGGTPKAIPAYASLRSMSTFAACAEAEALCQRGFTAIKIKMGRDGVAADLATIRALRSTLGQSIKLMVDYNQSLSVSEALDYVHVLDDEGLYWIEEPTTAEDFSGHAHIAAAARTPIQLGENWLGVADMKKSIEARASDHVMLDAMKIGGVSGWLQAAHLAADASLPVSSHTFPEFSAHLLAVTPTAEFLEYLDHFGSLLTRPVQVRDGKVVLCEQPGAGIEWDESRIAHL